MTLNIQTAEESSPGMVKMGESNDPVVVFIRHGRTPHNNLGLFTGWEDPPLAPDVSSMLCSLMFLPCDISVYESFTN